MIPSERSYQFGGARRGVMRANYMLLPGQVLRDRYRILRVVSSSDRGTVYQAIDTLHVDAIRICAIKEVSSETRQQALRAMFQRSFEREAARLAEVTHPAIPIVFDYFAAGGCSYLVHEYIRGQDLEMLLNTADSPPPVEQVRRWGIEICDALACLHAHQPEPIVFRELKPSNVMIDRLDRVKLIDFGIGKYIRSGQPNIAVGNEGYAPPEQYKGAVGPATDIYALGATLHHLLTRADPHLRMPFSFDQHPIRLYNPGVPESLALVIMRALAHDPAQRYSARMMKECLEKTNTRISSPDEQ